MAIEWREESYGQQNDKKKTQKVAYRISGAPDYRDRGGSSSLFCQKEEHHCIMMIW
jgi:hypothetical protein